MLILWFHAIATFFLKLIIPPPPKMGRIDPNGTCPACGNNGGKIECRNNAERVVVMHTCDTCGARWNEATIVQGGLILGTNQ